MSVAMHGYSPGLDVSSFSNHTWTTTVRFEKGATLTQTDIELFVWQHKDWFGKNANLGGGADGPFLANLRDTEAWVLEVPVRDRKPRH